jgi:hypothetical protein
MPTLVSELVSSSLCHRGAVSVAGVVEGLNSVEVVVVVIVVVVGGCGCGDGGNDVGAALDVVGGVVCVGVGIGGYFGVAANVEGMEVGVGVGLGRGCCDGCAEGGEA